MTDENPPDPKSSKDLEARALAATCKSEGMRLLFGHGYIVTEVVRVLGVSYGFAYGVAKRAGMLETAAARRAPGRGTARAGNRTTSRQPASTKRSGASSRTSVGADGLEVEFGRIKRDHGAAILKMTARSALPPFVTRAFQRKTKDALVELLGTMPIGEITALDSEAAFRVWYERQLDRVAACVLTLNPPRIRPGIHPGYHWGHAAKVLALFVRDVVLFSRYFGDYEVGRIAPWLCCPVDGVVLKRPAAWACGPVCR
jgi:hypothetical protein